MTKESGDNEIVRDSSSLSSITAAGYDQGGEQPVNSV
eukprot:CAMPEP_0118674224 /NCGR_PEP_ID=MMETSP0800-20121206/770_1 /TAXON_ID=210618 ORGANISM="Striatella unipunctata, Strain CCMP2910" /NCGR_SAMPLE_ID=MMETSP0800 /ASSEMBLY_ACC=CAM_ASM_000638 /LENGTH=36 /DNA_ID= /DNA_START= /DNA_END= /DNA_ORIENTATION=